MLELLYKAFTFGLLVNHHQTYILVRRKEIIGKPLNFTDASKLAISLNMSLTFQSFIFCRAL